MLGLLKHSESDWGYWPWLGIPIRFDATAQEFGNSAVEISIHLISQLMLLTIFSISPKIINVFRLELK